MPTTSASSRLDIAPQAATGQGQDSSGPTGRDEYHRGIEEEHQELFEVIQEELPAAPRDDIAHLESRMLSMENALERVIEFIEQKGHHQPTEQ